MCTMLVHALPFMQSTQQYERRAPFQPCVHTHAARLHGLENGTSVFFTRPASLQ